MLTTTNASLAVVVAHKHNKAAVSYQHITTGQSYLKIEYFFLVDVSSLSLGLVKLKKQLTVM